MSSNQQTAKVFQINEYEWWVGYDADSLLEYLREHSHAADEWGDPLELPFVELSDEDMERLVFVRDDHSKTSFKNALAEFLADGYSIPNGFASTEW